MLERLCAEADIAEKSLQRITVRGNIDICVTRLNGQVYAIIDRCGHMNAPLSRGELDGDVVTCPVHEAKYRLTSGTVVGPPRERSERNGDERAHSGAVRLGLDDLVRVVDVKPFKVSSQDGSLFVELP